MRSPFFEINSDPFYYPSDNNEDRENKLDSESKVQERAAEDVSVESRPVQAFYCNLCECKSRKIDCEKSHEEEAGGGCICLWALPDIHPPVGGSLKCSRMVGGPPPVAIRMSGSPTRREPPTAHERWVLLHGGQGGISPQV